MRYSIPIIVKDKEVNNLFDCVIVDDGLRSGTIERTTPKTPLQKWEEDNMSLRKSVNAM